MYQVSRDHALNLKKTTFIYFLTRTCSSTFKNYFVIAHLGKKFTIEAQQILDLPIRKRKLCKR